MGSWLPLLVFLLVGGGITAYLFAVRFRAEERAAGIRALTDMHWREFHRLVVAAIERRGYNATGEAQKTGSDEALVELHKDDERWLLATKHGEGYVLGHQALTSFANAIKLRGAHGGWMTTLGEVPADLVPQAQLQRIQLLDGRTLWSDIRPSLEHSQREAIASPVRRRATRHAVIGWLAAALVAVVAWLALPESPRRDEAPHPAVPAPRATPAASTHDTTPAGAKASTIPGSSQEVRQALAGDVATLAWVERATWSTASTLVLHVSGDIAVDKQGLCAIVERYTDLRASRVQVQPAPGSRQSVRFFQCRSY